MSIWTNRHGAQVAGLLAGAALSLAACLDAGAPAAARSVQIGPAGLSALTIAAPAGFCVAPRATSRLGGSDFVAFATCPGASAAPAAILTATVGPPESGAGGLPTAAELAAFLTSDQGRRVLSRSGNASTVTVHEVVEVEGVTMLRLTDRSPNPPGATEGWRGVVVQRNRLVTLAATGTRAGPALSRDAGLRLIGQFVASLRRANVAPTPQTAPQTVSRT